MTFEFSNTTDIMIKDLPAQSPVVIVLKRSGMAWLHPSFVLGGREARIVAETVAQGAAPTNLEYITDKNESVYTTHTPPMTNWTGRLEDISSQVYSKLSWR